MILNRIQEVLEKSGKSQKWLAEEVGTTTVTVNKWCKNKSQPPLKKLYLISTLLDCSLVELIVD